RKIRLIILVVSFFPMLLITGVLVHRFNQTYGEKIHAHIFELVQKHSQNIDTFLWERLANIRYLATLHQDQPSQSPSRFLRKQLKLLKLKYQDVFVDLGIVDAKGAQLAYEGPFRLDEADYSEAPWFLKAMETPYHISDVFIGLRGHPHFIVAVKTRHNGEICILRSTINLAAFNSLVENIHIGLTGSAFIINGQGKLQTRKPALLSSSILASLTRPDLPAHRASAPPRFEEKADADGTRYLSFTADLKHIPWRMVFCQKMDDAFRELRKTHMITLGIFILGCVAILFVAYTLPRTVVTLISSADRKNEAMNRQVVESGRLATIGELAAGIAHEINNPVAIMVEEAGWVKDLMEDGPDATVANMGEFHRALDQIASQGRRCKEITHKLLSFARKSDAQVNDVEVNSAIQEIVGLTAQMARYNKVIIQTDLGEQIPLVRFSLSELQQVILNLINNAVDATQKDADQKGGGKILVTTRIQDARFLFIAVEDNGPGIPKENLERIFDPFFTTKPVGKGTGLGLSICYGIIQKMGGKIEASSQVGKGSIFRIFLPLKPDTREPEPSGSPFHKRNEEV
ncbi:MAG: ATP-binding protein, partial [Desulfovibrionales bacterium]|nr:ATP-binding protein [Desulfovibrionales bacterium]